MTSRALRSIVIVVLLAILLAATYFLLKALRGPQVGPGRQVSLGNVSSYRQSTVIQVFAPIDQTVSTMGVR